LNFENEIPTVFSSIHKSGKIPSVNIISENKNLYNIKISALMHDFKHVSMDSYLFMEYLIQKHKINANPDDLLYMKFMNEYFNSLISNITSYMKDSDNFFSGSSSDNNQLVDVISIADMMITIFNRRQIWENESLEKNENVNYRKDLKIYHRIIEKENPNYKKVFSNKNYIISLFYNIVSNSFKHTKEGEIVIETSTLENKEICIKIIDTGEGVPENILRNWSNPFNIDPTNKDKASTGLGQFIIYSIAKTLKFNLSIPENNPSGKGTIFKIFIPISNNSISTGYNHDTSYYNTSQKTKIFNYDYPIVINNKDREGLYSIDHYKDPMSEIKTSIRFKIILFDDDVIILNSLINKLKRNLQNNLYGYEFEFIECYNFHMFYDKFHKQLQNKSTFDFFILDQNLSVHMTGLEIADMVEFTYRAYFEQNYENLFFYFLFVTEQAECLKNYFKNKSSKLFKFDQVFGKTENNEIASKIIKLISNKNG
jgi:anti-sigma regulatory factor (Ser/Thr protein kinase)